MFATLFTVLVDFLGRSGGRFWLIFGSTLASRGVDFGRTGGRFFPISPSENYMGLIMAYMGNPYIDFIR